MKLIDKRFWMWVVTITFIPVMMAIFAVLILIGINSNSELFNCTNLEIFLIWEITYLLVGLLSYDKLRSKGWIITSFICWGVVCPFIVVLSFIWAGIRIHDGFEGLAYFMISCISWGSSILPLLLGVYVYKKKYSEN